MVVGTLKRVSGFVRGLASFLFGPLYSRLTIPFLLGRLESRKRNFSLQSSTGYGLDRCAVTFINLARRPDRLRLIEDEFFRLGFGKACRFEAIEAKPGSLGCALSHTASLVEFDFNSELLMICEDDATFLVDRSELDDVIEKFYFDWRLDVLCLSYLVENELVNLDDTFAISNNVQTAACYVVRAQNVDRLVKKFSQSAGRLARGWPTWVSAIDIAWKSLQRWEMVFAVPRKLCVVQRASFSDIEGKDVDYFWG